MKIQDKQSFEQQNMFGTGTANTCLLYTSRCV